MTPEKPRRLGRGLEALLTVSGGKSDGGADDGDAFRRVPIAQIRPNPYQPRKSFRPEELAELEASIKASGLLQPITVRPAAVGQGYELIAGERRLRAATRLGWKDIPAFVKPIDDQTLLTLALVENLQRADLNPLEEAEGYQRLIAEFGFTQQQVADVVGKDRSTIANILRVLGLPAAARRMVQEGQLTLGHARALLAIENERALVELAKEVVAQGMSVREVERRVKEKTTAAVRDGQSKPRPAAPRDPQAGRIEDQLRRYLQTDVHLRVNGTARGEIRIQFYNNDDLERILELVLGGNGDAL
jgi:ParB family transcriptional regulator, chromosome partitioning protein